MDSVLKGLMLHRRGSLSSKSFKTSPMGTSSYSLSPAAAAAAAAAGSSSPAAAVAAAAAVVVAAAAVDEALGGRGIRMLPA